MIIYGVSLDKAFKDAKTVNGPYIENPVVYLVYIRLK